MGSRSGRAVESDTASETCTWESAKTGELRDRLGSFLAYLRRGGSVRDRDRPPAPTSFRLAEPE